jgi:hypothetical protein
MSERDIFRNGFFCEPDSFAYHGIGRAGPHIPTKFTRSRQRPIVIEIMRAGTIFETSDTPMGER